MQMIPKHIQTQAMGHVLCLYHGYTNGACLMVTPMRHVLSLPQAAQKPVDGKSTHLEWI